MVKGGIIETGVDKLVKLVNEKTRISTSEAAKILGVSPAVIDEWADFLEEEGIISLEYKLATTYLVERKLSKKEITKKEKEYHSSKEAFIRKVESAITTLDRECEGLENLKKEFAAIKKELGSDIDSVKQELAELENYERLKKNIDKQLLEQQAAFKNKIQELEKELLKEKSKYQELVDDIELERVKLAEEKSQSLGLKEQEAGLLKKLDEFSDIIKKIRESIYQEDKKIEITEEHIKALEKSAEKIKSRILEEKKKLEPLIEQSKMGEKKILSLQQDVLAKVLEKKKSMQNVPQDAKSAAKKFEAFFSRKNEVEKILEETDALRISLREELNNLIKKATAFNLASNSADVKKHISELEKKFVEVDKKRESFHNKLKKLLSLVKD
ncbi:MAG: hypothetical protein QXK37_01510 [Candidatus Woesearchaeota archaeon]